MDLFFKGMFATDSCAIWVEYSGKNEAGEDRWCVNVENFNSTPKNQLYKDLSLAQAKGLKEDIILLWT
jgi:hypothetical protein